MSPIFKGNMQTWTETKEKQANKIKTKTSKQLKVLKDNEFTDNKLYYYLKPTDSPAPRFYGQPKIHKPGAPIRPIVSYRAPRCTILTNT